MRGLLSKLTLICALFLVGALHADDYPAPKAEWWKDLTGKEKAVFEMDTGAMKLKQTYAIVKIDGAVITYSIAMEVNGTVMPAQEQTVDFTPKPQETTEGTTEAKSDVTVTKKGEEKVKAGDATLACTIYEVKTEASTATMWYCADLPPLFNGGSAKTVSAANGQNTTITLLEFSK